MDSIEIVVGRTIVVSVLGKLKVVSCCGKLISHEDVECYEEEMSGHELTDSN